LALLAGNALTEADRLVLAGAGGAALWALIFVRQVALHAYGQIWYLPFEALGAAGLALEAWGAMSGRPRARIVVAVIALAATVGSAPATPAARYSHPHGYAMRTSRALEQLYETHP